MLALLRRASLRRIWRALTIWRVVLQLLVLLWWDGQSWSYRNGDSPQTRAARQVSRARWLTAELLQLGSAFIKLGQLLSARPVRCGRRGPPSPQERLWGLRASDPTLQLLQGGPPPN